MDKGQIRKLMLEKRLNLKDRDILDNLIFLRLKKRLKAYRNIAGYYSFNGEVDTHMINKWILDNDKNLFLPKIVNDEIRFIKVDDLSAVSKSKFNVLEPVGNDYIDVNEVECMVIPMLAFNNDLYRLGYGKGYYDRVLKNYKGYRLGIAYACQECNELIMEEHDEKLDEIIVG